MKILSIFNTIFLSLLVPAGLNASQREGKGRVQELTALFEQKATTIERRPERLTALRRTIGKNLVEIDTDLSRAIEAGDYNAVIAIVVELNHYKQSGGEEVKKNVEERVLGHQLFKAVALGNLDIAATLIGSGRARVNVVDAQGNTALHVAASHGYSLMVALLLDAGAEIYAPNIYQETPLSLACRMHHKVVVRQLLRHGALADADSLIYTIGNDRGCCDEIVRELLAAGANPVPVLERSFGLANNRAEGICCQFIASAGRNMQMQDHEHPLIEALRNSCFPLFCSDKQRFLEQEHTQEELNQVLHYSARAGRADLVKMLLNNTCADVNSLSLGERSVFELAIQSQDPETVYMLFCMKDWPQYELKRALSVFAQAGATDIMQQALDKIGTDEKKYIDWKSVLECAWASRNEDTVNVILNDPCCQRDYVFEYNLLKKEKSYYMKAALVSLQALTKGQLKAQATNNKWKVNSSMDYLKVPRS